MMEMKVSSQEIDTAGRGIQGVAARLHDDLAGFRAELAGHGEPWGKELNDQIGPLIGACYTAIAGVAMSCYAKNVETLGRHGDATRATAANYRGSDEASVSTVNRVRDLLG
jgi:hypothetical protein